MAAALSNDWGRLLDTESGLLQPLFRAVWMRFPIHTGSRLKMVFFDANSDLTTSRFCIFHCPAVPKICLSYYLFLIHVRGVILFMRTIYSVMIPFMRRVSICNDSVYARKRRADHLPLWKACSDC